MPINKRAQPEAEKRAEIIDAACELFVQDGYDSTPVNRIAKHAGVTPNTIYWYFKDKDDLLVAVLDRLMRDALADYSTTFASPLAHQLLWLVERLRKVRGLVATVHGRIRVSPVIEQWHSGFHALIEETLFARLPTPISLELRHVETLIVSFAIEGMISHDTEPRAIKRICEALAQRLEAICLEATPSSEAT